MKCLSIALALLTTGCIVATARAQSLDEVLERLNAKYAARARPDARDAALDPFSKALERPASPPLAAKAKRPLPLPTKRTSKEDMWYADDDQEALAELLKSTRVPVAGIYFYRPQQFTDSDYVDPWLVPGGLKGLVGWRSFNGASLPKSGSWTTGAPYEDGQMFVDLLVNARTAKVFTLRVAQKSAGEWRNRVLFADKAEFPRGFEPGGVFCASCHTAGSSAPRSKEGRISFLR